MHPRATLAVLSNFRPAPLRSGFFALALLLLAGLTLPALIYLGLSLPARPAPLFVLLLAQSSLAGALALVWFRRRIKSPVQSLSVLADDLAAGRLDRPLAWHRGDEVGRLAASLEATRQSMQRQAVEQQAIFNRIPVGILFVRNRVVETANHQAEALLAYPPGRLVGCGTEVIYPTREDYFDVGVHAYAHIERGETFGATLTLARRDGSVFRAVLGGRALDPAKPQDGSVWSITELPASPC